MAKMSEDKLSKTELAFGLLSQFPTMLRASVLEDDDFRRKYGLAMKANIRFNQSGVTFDREELYAAVRSVLGNKTTTQTVSALDKSLWTLSPGQEASSLLLSQGQQQIPLPGLLCLSPDRQQRLDWLEQEKKSFDLGDEDINRWHDILAERPCDDEEVEQLRNEFRMTPRWFTGALIGALQRPSVSIPNIVPADVRYFERLVGSPSEIDLATYVETVITPHVAKLVAANGIQGVKQALLLSAHSWISKTINVQEIPEKDILALFEWLEVKGDRISQLGAVELGLAHLDKLPALEPILTKIIAQFATDREDEGRLANLSGLIVLTEGEIARTGVLRNQRPFWRRLATFAHASLLEREMHSHGIPADEPAKWGIENRGGSFYYQTCVDLRREPRWLPDFLSAAQLKSEFVGRIFGAATQHEGKITSAELRRLALEKCGPIQSLIVFPYPFLPGPLEGGVESTVVMDAEIEREVMEGLKTEVVTPKSFTPLVNSALIFKLGPQLAELAADALRRAKYHLRGMAAQSNAFGLLHGLATVAAVTRSEGLASEVRILLRVVRGRPGMNISLNDALRIATIAAAAHADIDKWCRFLGEWLTEFAYEDMERDKATMLWNFIRGLCQIEKGLWSTCARADAASAAVMAA